MINVSRQRNPLALLFSVWNRLRFDLAAYVRFDDGRRRMEQRLLDEIDRLEALLAVTQLTPGGRPIVMGLAAHYNAAELAPFVVSLRRAGYTGDVTLLSFGTSLETARFLRDHDVALHPFSSLGAMPMSMNSSRMIECLDALLAPLLNSPETVFDNLVMLTDVRDVIFQGDPFARLPPVRLACFLETGRTINSCPVNRDWLLRACGDTAVQELGKKPVSCAGTVMGRRSGIMLYLLQMVRMILAVPPSHRFSGVDQAIHNVILHRGLVPGSMGIENGGSVLTIPHEPGYARLENDRIVNSDGQISEVVHQYDRHQELVEWVAKMYRTNVPD